MNLGGPLRQLVLRSGAREHDRYKRRFGTSRVRLAGQWRAPAKPSVTRPWFQHRHDRESLSLPALVIQRSWSPCRASLRTPREQKARLPHPATSAACRSFVTAGQHGLGLGMTVRGTAAAAFSRVFFSIPVGLQSIAADELLETPGVFPIVT